MSQRSKNDWLDTVLVSRFRVSKGWSEALERPRASLLVLVVFGVWLHAADALLVSTMLPAIVAELGGAGSLHWSIAFYEIGSIIGTSISGYLMSRCPFDKAFRNSVALFSVGCLISTFATSFEILISGRLLQGLSGGCLVGLSFVVVRRAFPPRHYGRAMACVTTIWAASAFIGPLLGGIAVGLGSWRYGFAAFCVQALALVVVSSRNLALAGFDKGEAASSNHLPFRQLTLLACGVTALALAGPGETSFTMTTLVILLGLVCLYSFLLSDRRAVTTQILPSEMMRVMEPRSAGLWMVLFLAAATIAISAYVPFFLVRLQNISALAAGYVVATEALCWTVTAVLFAGTAERRDRRTIAMGVGIIAASCIGFLLSVPGGYLQWIVLSACAQGVGFGMAWALIMRRILGLMPESDKDRAAAAIPFLQRIGFALGASFLGLLASAAGLVDGADTEQLRHAARIVFIGCLIPLAIAILLCIRFLRGGSSETPDAWETELPKR